MKISKKQLLKDRQALLDEIAALQEENLRLRTGRPPEQAVPDSPEEEAAMQAGKYSRFPLLRAVDEAYENAEQEPEQEEPVQALTQVAEHLRRYAAAHFGLYANRTLYAHFLSAMASSDFLLLRSCDNQRSALTFCRAAAAAWGQNIDITQVQPAWSRPADLLGEPDPATKRYKETEFLRCIYEAGCRKGIRFAVLDNVTAAPPHYLAQLLPVLSLSHHQTNLARRIPLAQSVWPDDPALLEDGALPWPENLWLAGTLPPDAPAPSPQLRSAAMEFCLPSLQNSKPFLTTLEQPMPLPASRLRSLFAHAREVFALPEETLRLFALTETHLAEHMECSLGAQALPQLQVFGSICLACGLRPTQALDGFFYQKALRRLESLEPSVLKYELPGLLRFLAETFGKKALPLTMQMLDEMQQAQLSAKVEFPSSDP